MTFVISLDTRKKKRRRTKEEQDAFDALRDIYGHSVNGITVSNIMEYTISG
jgi:hypothetical protein